MTQSDLRTPLAPPAAMRTWQAETISREPLSTTSSFSVKEIVDMPREAKLGGGVWPPAGMNISFCYFEKLF